MGYLDAFEQLIPFSAGQLAVTPTVGNGGWRDTELTELAES